MSEVTETVKKCEHWYHVSGVQPRASHVNTKTKEWRCYSCVQNENRGAMQRARKFNAVYTNDFVTAEEYLFHLLSK